MVDWNLRYLDLAHHIASWSKDPSSQLGAVVVGDKGQILSQGYNGFPRGIADDERLLERETKYPRIVHAEMNCIYNACHNGVSLNGGTMYIHGLPMCDKCAPGIIQVGIKKVFMAWPVDQPEKARRWMDSWAISKEMLTEAEVEFTAYGFKSEDNNWLDSVRINTSNRRELSYKRAEREGRLRGNKSIGSRNYRW